MDAAVKPACGRGKRAARGAKEVNKQTQRLLEHFDSCNTEHRSELDVDKLGKRLQREHHLTLR